MPFCQEPPQLRGTTQNCSHRPKSVNKYKPISHLELDKWSKKNLKTKWAMQINLLTETHMFLDKKRCNVLFYRDYFYMGHHCGHQKHTDVKRGHRKYVLSMFSTATYSPWDSLNIFFFLSMIFIAPLGCHSPMSPALFSKLGPSTFTYSLN